MHGTLRLLGLLALLLSPACGDDDSSPADDGGVDVPVEVAEDVTPDLPAEAEADADAEADVGPDVGPDADSFDEAEVEAGADVEPDAGPDADVPAEAEADVPADALDGFGTLSGACGVLDDAEWTSSSPFLFRGSIDFGTTAYDPALLSEGAREILADGTAGGSSGESEAISYDVLYRCELAALLLSETEIAYDPPTSVKTDYLSSIDARNVGVSVTRAYRYPPSEPCLESSLATLLERKLRDCRTSQANAAPANPWGRSILHVIAYSAQCADATEAAYATLDAAVRSDVILYLTVTDGDDAFLY
ncbi:MAG: hypothetical protein JXB32_06440 [Deltaproteobacteria bacterium]|nr:hypothetical protein [Deltaproteobacteria bacterium]